MRLPIALPLLVALQSCGAGSGAEDAQENGSAKPDADELTQVSKTTRDPTPAPLRPAAILFDGKMHDFGAVSDVFDLEHSFSFMNVGDEPLVIEEIKAECGCTATELARTEIEGGGVESLGVVWDLIGGGRQHKTIAVRTNDSEQALVVLSVAATIQPFATCTPNLVKFGAVRNSEQHMRSFRLSSLDPDFTVVSFESPPDVELRASASEEDGSVLVEALLLPSPRRGNYIPKASIRIAGHLEGTEVVHDVPVKISANLYTELLVEPPFLALGKVATGAAIDYRVRVTRPSGGRFEITRAEITTSTVSGLSVTEVASADGYEIVLSGTVVSSPGRLSGQIVLETDLPSEPARTLSFMGMVE